MFSFQIHISSQWIWKSKHENLQILQIQNPNFSKSNPNGCNFENPLSYHVFCWFIPDGDSKANMRVVLAGEVTGEWCGGVWRGSIFLMDKSNGLFSGLPWFETWILSVMVCFMFYHFSWFMEQSWCSFHGSEWRSQWCDKTTGNFDNPQWRGSLWDWNIRVTFFAGACVDTL